MRPAIKSHIEQVYGPLPKPKRETLYLVYSDRNEPGSDVFVIFFTLSNAPEVFRTLGRWASNPDIDFTWYQAAQVSQQVNKIKEEAKAQ